MCEAVFPWFNAVRSLFPFHHPLLPPCALCEDDWGRVKHNYQKPMECTQKLINPYGSLVYYNHPTYFKVTRLVKEVNCQYAFGVYTKWDEAIQKHEKEHSQISLDYVREKYTKKYLESVNSHDQRATIDDVFFVDSQHVLRQIKVSFLSALKLPSKNVLFFNWKYPEKIIVIFW